MPPDDPLIVLFSPWRWSFANQVRLLVAIAVAVVVAWNLIGDITGQPLIRSR